MLDVLFVREMFRNPVWIADRLDSVDELTSRLTVIRVVLCCQVFSFVHAQFTFFHQGFDLLRDLEPTLKAMAAQVLTAEPILPVIHII